MFYNPMFHNTAASDQPISPYISEIIGMEPDYTSDHCPPLEVKFFRHIKSNGRDIRMSADALFPRSNFLHQVIRYYCDLFPAQVGHHSPKVYFVIGAKKRSVRFADVSLRLDNLCTNDVSEMAMVVEE